MKNKRLTKNNESLIISKVRNRRKYGQKLEIQI